MISRRDFFKKTIHASIASTLMGSLHSCTPSISYTQTLSGPNATLGHRLRSMDFGSIQKKIETEIVIIGGGVAGLSAARFLKKNTDNFLLLEIGEETGGNALGGSNSISSYPLGAHYLPIPNQNDPELINFLEEANVITGYENNTPVLNEYYLCFDPKERLFINNYWQEGLVPHEGVPLKDRDEIRRFHEEMNIYKNYIGIDGKEAFCIPVARSSKDEAILKLDTITIDQYLSDKGFTSPYLRWYVGYCCADDYGTTLKETSAWACIHYFASRKGKAANASSDQILTWPEGNHWLIKQLRKTVIPNIRHQSVVFAVNKKTNGFSVLYFDAVNNMSVEITTKKVIMATPEYINKRILEDSSNISTNLDYSPWMVSNLTVNGSLTEKRGETLCWDNVVYGSQSLGYVNAAHQQLGASDKKVITFYHPVLGSDTAAIRKRTQSRSIDFWKTTVLNDLKKPHPTIEEELEEMNIWIWGHGIVKPKPGFLSHSTINLERKMNNIFFANSDISGISIFEEAFYNGYQAAQQCIKSF